MSLKKEWSESGYKAAMSYEAWLEMELAEHRALFQLQHRRMKKATAMWQEATGEKDVHPDLGVLLDCLMLNKNTGEGEINPFCEHCKEKPDCLVSTDGTCAMIRKYLAETEMSSIG